jgi:hypothetical protein
LDLEDFQECIESHLLKYKLLLRFELTRDSHVAVYRDARRGGHALEFLTVAGSQEHVGRVGFVLDIRRSSASRAWLNLAGEVVSILRFESARERTSALLLKS